MSFDAVIDVQNVSKRFGGLRAVNDCSLRVERGSITGLIGPNGAGKSTLFNLVAGNIVPDSGRIIFDGQDVTGLKPHQLFHRGMLRTFQIAHEFSNMTALEKSLWWQESKGAPVLNATLKGLKPVLPEQFAKYLN